jgi:hypothetical protein
MIHYITTLEFVTRPQLSVVSQFQFSSIKAMDATIVSPNQPNPPSKLALAGLPI